MTARPTGSSETVRRLVGNDRATSAVRRHAFRALLVGHAMTLGELATATGLTADQVERAIADLRDTGALEVDAGSRVIGAHGLTQRRTEHTIVTTEHTWHTWCALDAIGIPAALGIDAAVRTRCPTCDATIDVVLHQGSPTAEREPILWQPEGPCSHVMDDFCAAANLFCNTDHLEQWRIRAGEPPGRPLTITDVAEHGRQIWSDITR
jgi:alkylmercury lyase